MRMLPAITPRHLTWVAEYRFHPTRKWRFDFACPDAMLAFEIDGGTWTGGRHTTGSGYEKDCEKLNAAAELGWIVLRFLPGQIKSNAFLITVKKCLERP